VAQVLKSEFLEYLHIVSFFSREFPVFLLRSTEDCSNYRSSQAAPSRVPRHLIPRRIESLPPVVFEEGDGREGPAAEGRRQRAERWSWRSTIRQRAQARRPRHLDREKNFEQAISEPDEVPTTQSVIA